MEHRNQKDFDSVTSGRKCFKIVKKSCKTVNKVLKNTKKPRLREKKLILPLTGIEPCAIILLRDGHAPAMIA